jgi:hypothetical protein
LYPVFLGQWSFSPLLNVQNLAKYCPPLGKIGTLLQLGVIADKSAAEVSAGEDWAGDNHGAD